MKAERSAGGLGPNEQQIGLYYGTYGAAPLCWGHCWQAITFRTGDCGGRCFSVLHLQSAFWCVYPVCHLPAGKRVLIGSAIVLEYFWLWFWLLWTDFVHDAAGGAGKHQMAHYAFASGIMNLGVMLPGTISGFVSDWLGYEAFFTFTLFATIPAFLITYFIPFTYADEKKQQ